MSALIDIISIILLCWMTFKSNYNITALYNICIDIITNFVYGY